MATSKQQSCPLAQANKAAGMPILLTAVSTACLLILSGCQTVPSPPATGSPAPVATNTVEKTTVAIPADSSDEVDQETYPTEPDTPPMTQPDRATPEPEPPRRVIITPAEDDVVIQPPVLVVPSTPPPISPPVLPPVVTPPTLPTPSHNELLERARQNSVQRTPQTTSSNSNLPAFRNLMQAGINQLSAGNLTSAENSFTRAQRLAPKSSAVYFYLSQVAIKKNQPRKAEAMARRGLSVSEDSIRRRTLWQLVLRSGQMQNNTRVIREAQQALR